MCGRFIHRSVNGAGAGYERKGCIVWWIGVNGIGVIVGDCGRGEGVNGIGVWGESCG